jgi:hypothetical protein
MINGASRKMCAQIIGVAAVIVMRQDRHREQVEVTTNTNLKVRYESYEEVRAALLEEGINIDRLPMLEDLRSVEEQEPEQEPS